MLDATLGVSSAGRSPHVHPEAAMLDRDSFESIFAIARVCVAAGRSGLIESSLIDRSSERSPTGGTSGG